MLFCAFPLHKVTFFRSMMFSVAHKRKVYSSCRFLGSTNYQLQQLASITGVFRELETSLNSFLRSDFFGFCYNSVQAS